GTPITGHETYPPTTLGSAPSIPATTTTAAACSKSASRAGSRAGPATPTSSIIVTRTPIQSSVSRASSATGKSPVPAEITATNRFVDDGGADLASNRNVLATLLNRPLGNAA